MASHDDQPGAELVPLGAEVRRLPVPVAAAAVAPVRRPPAVSLSTPVVAATGGMVAGMVTMALVRLLWRGTRAPAPGRRRRAERAHEVAATRSFLVDVHLLRRE